MLSIIYGFLNVSVVSSNYEFIRIKVNEFWYKLLMMVNVLYCFILFMEKV